MIKAGISVIVISFNTKELLAECLESLLIQLDLAVDEIHVVDNNSHDGSGSMVKEKFPGVTLHANTLNKGFSSACNTGWLHSQKPFVLFSNGDVYFPQGQL